jgi:hypothetical protein
VYGPHLRWLTFAQEALAIVMFGTTLERGMNTNVVDRARSSGGRNPSQTHALWASLHEITKNHLIPASTSPTFPAWHKIHVYTVFPYETPLGWYKHIRKIASEAKFTSLPHFPPLPDAAWHGTTPKLRIKGRKMYTRVAPDLNHTYTERSKLSSWKTNAPGG